MVLSLGCVLESFSRTWNQGSQTLCGCVTFAESCGGTWQGGSRAQAAGVLSPCCQHYNLAAMSRTPALGASQVLEPGLTVPLILDIYGIMNLRFAAVLRGLYSYSKSSNDKGQGINGSFAIFIFFSASQGIDVHASWPTCSPAPEAIGSAGQSTRSQIRKPWLEIPIWMPPTYMTLAKQKSPALASTY